MAGFLADLLGFNNLAGQPQQQQTMVNGALSGATQTQGGIGQTAVGDPVAPEVQVPGAETSMFGWNMDTAKLALGGLQTLGNLWMGARALKMAKEQFNYQKGVTETNLVNSIQSYNTALTDRAMNRADAINSGRASAEAYVDENKAVRV